MKIHQRTELKHLMAPALRQSLKILSIASLDLKTLIEEELVANPCLEEQPTEEHLQTTPPLTNRSEDDSQSDFMDNIPNKAVSLQEVLLRQLGMFANTDEELRIGHEIIWNIDENGYLKATLEELCMALNTSHEEITKVLGLIQQFEPSGVGARNISECLTIQLKRNNETNPLLFEIAENQLKNIAKKNYSLISKQCKQPQEIIESLIQKISKLDPKPGRNFLTRQTQYVAPDITIEKNDETLKVVINNEYFPNITISSVYKKLLKKGGLDQITREFIENKMQAARELLRAVEKRTTTLRKVAEKLAEIQQDAIKEDLSYLKPLTFAELAKQIDVHESTVCRTVMNKYVDAPCGIVALKDFFTHKISDCAGQSISVNYIKKTVKELIEQEDKKHPLSDKDLAKSLLEKFNFKVARRTIAKYRDELKIPSTAFRRFR